MLRKPKETTRPYHRTNNIRHSAQLSPGWNPRADTLDDWGVKRMQTPREVYTYRHSALQQAQGEAGGRLVVLRSRIICIIYI